MQTNFYVDAFNLYYGGGRKPSYHFSKVAAASPIVPTAHLAASQVPATLTDAAGTFHKPAA